MSEPASKTRECAGAVVRGTRQTEAGGPAAYRALPLVVLVRLIVENRDRVALRELHDHRRPFRSANNSPIRLAEYVDELRQTPRISDQALENPLVLDRAYDLTIDKFSRLESPATGFSEATQRRKGTDCTFYFAALLRHLSAKSSAGQRTGELRQEMLCSYALQGLVRMHFELSCLEHVRRLEGPVRRHIWQLDGGILSLWFPTAMSGRECRRWLEEHIDDPDPVRPGERDRVQTIINARLVLPKIISLEQTSECPGGLPFTSPPLPWSVLHEISTRGLVEAVAREKGENIHLQRPAIQRLGAQGLRSLVRRIFEDLSNDAYEAGAVAAAFGLSPATLTRFAGCRWNDRQNGSEGVPDLFVNTAHTLARVPVFVQAAQAAGVWPNIEEVRRRHPCKWDANHVQ